ncbi:hypothetical protein M6G53_25360, partial [Serratia nevei]|nr:hypothetical protein [Serratia nevei]
EAGVLPRRISFVAALNLLVSQVRVSDRGAPGNIPKHLRGMREMHIPTQTDHQFRYKPIALYDLIRSWFPI